MNKVIYDSYEFSDADLTLGSGASAKLYYAPLGDELRADECQIPIIYRPRTWQVAAEDFIANYNYATPLDLYDDSTLLHRFYLTDITGGTRNQDGTYNFVLHGVNFTGLFATVPYRGNIFTSARFGDVIAEILGATQTGSDADSVIYETASGIEYKVASGIDGAQLDGYVKPTQDARNAVRDVLQIAGVIQTQQSDGTPIYQPFEQAVETAITKYDIYAGDKYELNSPVTECRVVEYAYFKEGAVESLLIDASAETLDNAEVTFKSPQFDLRADGLTIVESSATYAILSGTGKLYGKAYNSTSRVLSRATSRSGAENIRTIDNTLCSSLYSSYLLSRMVNYFGAVETVKGAIASASMLKAGAKLAYPDPMNEDQTGYITTESVTFSGITKHDAEYSAGWDAEQDAPFTESQLITTDGTWTVPDGVIRLRFYLIGGGDGGQGGFPGQHGDSNMSSDPGAGGPVGAGGDGGNVLQVDVEYADIEASYDITVGAAGAAGAIDGGAGGAGGDTTIDIGGTTYTSANGSKHPYGVIDLTDGTIYAAQGREGFYPGCRSTIGGFITDTLTVQPGYTPTSWTNGNYNSSSTGGGAAYGSNGGNAISAHAGYGADAVLDGFGGWSVLDHLTAGQGGFGGNGGGGGGTPRDQWDHNGLPGHGSVGSVGGTGAVLVLIAYGTPPTPKPDKWLYDADDESLFDYNFERLKEA